MTTLDSLITEVHDRTPRGGPLEQLATASQVASRLGEMADHLVGHFVDQARRSGASWQLIGTNLGVTRQAAQQRFVAADIETDKFTNRATVVLLTAQNFAREHGHPQVTSAHLVMAMLNDPNGFAVRALGSIGVDLTALADAIAALLPADRIPGTEQAVFAHDARKLCELAVRESLRLGHGYVGTEHLLLALLAGDDDPARAVTSKGASQQAVQSWTLQELERMRTSHC